MNDANKLVLQGSDNFLATWMLINCSAILNFDCFYFMQQARFRFRRPHIRQNVMQQLHLISIICTGVSYFAHNKRTRRKGFWLDNWNTALTSSDMKIFTSKIKTCLNLHFSSAIALMSNKQHSFSDVISSRFWNWKSFKLLRPKQFSFEAKVSIIFFFPNLKDFATQCIKKECSNHHWNIDRFVYIYCCTVHFEDSLNITHQQMHQFYIIY